MPSAPFPVFLTLAGRPVLLAGGGAALLAKARLLAPSGAHLVVLSPFPDAGFEALEAPGGLTLERRSACAADVAGKALIFAEAADAATAQLLFAVAREAGVPVNVPDQPELSTFIMPAIVERAPVSIAISTAGAAPVLARRVKSWIEAALPARLGRLASWLERLRQAPALRGRDLDSRRRLTEALLDGPAGQALLAGDEPAAERAAEALLAAPEAEAGGSVALVGAGPGDPDLMTLRALRVLADAEVIVHDKLVDPRVLEVARRDARRIFVGKSKACHTLGQAEINALLVAEARAGHRVVRLKGGDPFVFGRGGEEMEALRAAGVPVTVVPGLTAALGCGAATGIPLTHRDLGRGVTFVSGHAKADGSEPDWSSLARPDHTLAIYMGLSTLPRVARRLTRAGLSPATPTAIVENGTRPDQRLLVGTLADLPAKASAAGLRGPALVIVGEVVRLADPALIEPIETPSLRLAS